MNDVRLNGVEMPTGYRLYMTPESRYYWSLEGDYSAWIDDKMKAISCAYHHADLITKQLLPKQAENPTQDKEYVNSRSNPTTADKE